MTFIRVDEDAALATTTPHTGSATHPNTLHGKERSHLQRS